MHGKLVSNLLRWWEENAKRHAQGQGLSGLFGWFQGDWKFKKENGPKEWVKTWHSWTE